MNEEIGLDRSSDIWTVGSDLTNMVVPTSDFLKPGSIPSDAIWNLRLKMDGRDLDAVIGAEEIGVSRAGAWRMKALGLVVASVSVLYFGKTQKNYAICARGLWARRGSLGKASVVFIVIMKSCGGNIGITRMIKRLLEPLFSPPLFLPFVLSIAIAALSSLFLSFFLLSLSFDFSWHSWEISRLSFSLSPYYREKEKKHKERRSFFHCWESPKRHWCELVWRLQFEDSAPSIPAHSIWHDEVSFRSLLDSLSPQLCCCFLPGFLWFISDRPAIVSFLPFWSCLPKLFISDISLCWFSLFVGLLDFCMIHMFSSPSREV